MCFFDRNSFAHDLGQILGHRHITKDLCACVLRCRSKKERGNPSTGSRVIVVVSSRRIWKLQQKSFISAKCFLEPVKRV